LTSSKNEREGFGGSRIRGFKWNAEGASGLKDSGEMLQNYKELKVWQKSYQLCLAIYRITARFPKDEKFGLTSQMRRASVSVPSKTNTRILEPLNP
jgi:hypothetical protein